MEAEMIGTEHMGNQLHELYDVVLMAPKFLDLKRYTGALKWATMMVNSIPYGRESLLSSGELELEIVAYDSHMDSRMI